MCRFTQQHLQPSNQHSQQHITLLLQRVAHCAVGVEVRPAAGVPRDAFSKACGHVVAGLEPVNLGMHQRGQKTLDF